jgi:hypothetical protein
MFSAGAPNKKSRPNEADGFCLWDARNLHALYTHPKRHVAVLCSLALWLFDGKRASSWKSLVF